MKVAFLLNYFPKISETFLAYQVKGLLDRGHDVRIFAFEQPDKDTTHAVVEECDLISRATYLTRPTSYTDGLQLLGESLVRYPRLTPEIFRSLTRGTEGALRISALKQFASDTTDDFDVYHAHFGSVGKYWDFIPYMTDSPFVVSFYGRDASQTLSNKQQTFQHLFDVVDAVTVLSEDMRHDVVVGGCPRGKTYIQPLPVDTERFSASPRDLPQNGQIRILSVARFVEKKGLEDALVAVDNISQSYDIQWTIAGDGELRADFESEVAQRGLEERIEVLGWVNQQRVRELLEDAHLFLLPSKTSADGDKEGTPTVLLEAQAAAVPVLSTKHAGIPEIVADDNSGYLVSEDDPEALSDALGEFLSSPEKWEEMGQNGRKFVEEHHSVSAVATQLEELYWGLIDNDISRN